jgi:2'-5' RNA ligase
MRVFIAIELPEEIRNRLTAIQAELRASGTAARWVPAESAHLTLKFIGEVSDKRREDIDGALDGLQASTMEGRTQEIDARLERAGFDKEKRAFRPHITLARAKTSRLESSLVKAAEKFAETDFGSFVVDRCFLYQSTLKPAGSVYTKIKEYML